jgi:hypothetical protein
MQGWDAPAAFHHVSVVENNGVHLTSSGTTPEKQLEHPSLAYNSEVFAKRGGETSERASN